MLLKIFCRKNAMFLASLLFGLFLHPDTASAQAVYNALVTIPGIPSGAGVTVYLSGLYNFLISVVGLVAMGAIVIGGARYLTSVGNPSAIEDAKHTIYSAIYGLIIAITSWVIVTTINPDITVLKNPAMSMTTGTYGSGAKYGQCALAGGDGTAAAPCKCINGDEVLAKSPMPPTVVSTSPAPCTEITPITAPAAPVIITYSEPMDKASVEAPAAVTIAGHPAFTSAAVTRVLDATGRILTITPDPALALGVNIGSLVQVIGGNPALNKNLAGTPMAATYNFSFYTSGYVFVGGCTPPLAPVGSLCNRVCMSKDLSADNNYHCLKADLRVGTTFMPQGKTVTVKVGEEVYFDGRTYSYDGLYPALKTNVSSDGPGFDNGIDRYEIDYSTPWLGWTSDYAKSETTGCDILLGALGFLGNALFDVTYTGGMTSTSYGAAGKYEGWLRVVSKNGCYGPVVDKVQINVNP